MRTLGIIGGTSWESTAVYYRLINEGVRNRLGGLHSAHLVLASVDFQGYSDDMAAGRWDSVEAGLLDETDRLVGAGAEALLIASNTMHLMAESISHHSGLRVLHIADATGGAIKNAKLRRIGLLGTQYTMEMGFYKDRFRDSFGIESIIPGENERKTITGIIFDELCKGVFKEESKRMLIGIVDDLAAAGAEGIVLGCTELPLVIKQADIALPLWDTLGLHATMAVDFLTAND
jgi:aspartate racemase